MRQRACEHSFCDQGVGKRRIRLLAENLDRHFALERSLRGQQDLSHATGAESLAEGEVRAAAAERW